MITCLEVGVLGMYMFSQCLLQRITLRFSASARVFFIFIRKPFHVTGGVFTVN